MAAEKAKQAHGQGARAGAELPGHGSWVQDPIQGFGDTGLLGPQSPWASGLQPEQPPPVTAVW